jgi:ribosomal protein L25 (general stress protein Ctc)
MKISGNIPAKERKKGNTNPYFKEGLIPSIIYGGNTDPVMVALTLFSLKKDLMRVASTQKYLKSNLVIKKKQ